MSDILAQVATNTDSVRTTGNSILYECVQTIMNVDSSGGLRVLGINILGRFLSNKDNNIRYVALNTLAKVVSIDAQAVQRHRETIVECVKDADVSIRKIALELVYSLVNESNIKTLTKELLDYLAVSDSEFKPDLTSKICMLIQRYSPDKRWHVDNLIKILVQAGQYVKPEVCRRFVVLITNAPTLQPYAVRSLYTALKESYQLGFSSLITVSCWCIGEYGDYLMNGETSVEDEAVFKASEQEIVELLEIVLQRLHQDIDIKEYALTALMKLVPKLPTQRDKVRFLLDRYKSDVILEVQQRCCEYIKLLNQYETLCPQLFERMPALDEKEYTANLGIDVTLPVENGTTENGHTKETQSQVKRRKTQRGMWAQDLLELDDILGPQPTQPTVAMDILGDLMDTSQPAQTSTPVTSPQAPTDLLDMLSLDTLVFAFCSSFCRNQTFRFPRRR